MKAMVLAAGLGTRLRPITYSVPKPMAPVLNRPVMEHIIGLLRSHGFDQVIANLHWFPDTIRGHFGDGSDFGIELSYSPEDALLGTAGGVRNAAAFFDGDFLVISGDALTDIDLAAMRTYHQSHDGVATLATRKVEDTSQFGVVITDDAGRIQGFQEKPDPAEALSNLANCGIYMFDPAIFDFFPGPGESALASGDDPEGFADWAMDVFPALLESGESFYSHEVDSYWNDVGTIGELLQGCFDGLNREVALEIPEPEVSPGVWSADGVDLTGTELEGPVLIGPGCRIGEGVAITGPAVLGRGCTLGDRVKVREAVLLDDAELVDGSFAVGGVVGR
jgi:mannose-1-phosphate guanylyltransferase/mannose-1-phosphate guanylyltransferase/phosphomannomutase